MTPTKAILATAAHDTVGFARAKFPGRNVAADARRCLEAALAGIEEWLDAVYNHGVPPEEADFYFLVRYWQGIKGKRRGNKGVRPGPGADRGQRG